jgi:hypothetical protein
MLAFIGQAFITTLAVILAACWLVFGVVVLREGRLIAGAMLLSAGAAMAFFGLVLCGGIKLRPSTRRVWRGLPPPLAVVLWLRSLLLVLFLGPIWFCGVVAMLDGGQFLGAVLAFAVSWCCFFAGIGRVLPRRLERILPGLGVGIALFLLLATGVLFLPQLLLGTS